MHCRVGSSLTGKQAYSTCVVSFGGAICLAMVSCAFVIHVRSRFALTACCIAMRATLGRA